MAQTPEGAVQSAILDYLRLRGHFAFRLNNIPPTFFDKQGHRQFRRLPTSTMRGIPDIVLIHKGRFFGIECKGPGGKLSEHQAEFARLCVKHGGEYIVAHSIDDVVRAGL